MIIQSIVVVSGLSLVFGLGLAYFANKFSVKENPKVAEVREVLPGANCGACGMAGCDAFAEAVVQGKVPVDACIPGQKSVAEKIAKILDKAPAKERQKKVARLHCNGTVQNCGFRFSYEGIETCKAANLVQKGFKKCDYGCLGLGDCVDACPFDAISMKKDGLPEVDSERCTACGKCVKICPKSLYQLVPEDKKIHVLCHSKDAAAKVAKDCKVGCIACRLCEKNCPVDAIHVVDNLAVIDYEKCIQCGKCVQVCPRKIIVDER